MGAVMDRDLEEDIKNDAEIMTKLKDGTYSQNVYAAMCNMRWQPQEVWSVLKDEYWTCSWRGAGGIVADLRGHGENYMDYYCSGIIGEDLSESDPRFGFVPEGEVTDEVLADFARIGWRPSPYPRDETNRLIL